MNSKIQQFLDFLEKEDDQDYGDFKRDVDLHLMQMLESLGPISSEHALQIQRMREQLLWSYNFNVEEMRQLLIDETRHLGDFTP